MDKSVISPSPAAAGPIDRHHPILVVLHWLLAVLLIAALAQGALVLKKVPNVSLEKLDLLRVHMLGGILILLLTVVRLGVTISTRHPPAMPRGAALSRLSRVVHALLYILVLSMAATGLAIAIAAGLPDIAFGGIGTLPATFDGLPPRALHGSIAKLLMVTIAGHVVAALHHQFIRKDGLMRRMLLKGAPN